MNIEQVCRVFLVAAIKFYFKRYLLLWQIKQKKPWTPQNYEIVKKEKKHIVQRSQEVSAVGFVKRLKIREILLNRKSHEK